MSSDVDQVTQPISEALIADAEFAIRIYEEGEPVGVVNVDEKTYKYHGSSGEIRRRLSQMEEQGLWYRAPAAEEHQPDDPWRMVTTKIERTGKHLGQYLTRRLERIPLDDTDVQTEPLGFEREQVE
jgi:hypothetical protein